MATYAKAAVGIGMIALLLDVSVLAQQDKLPPAAPIPQQVSAAKRVFIGNAGGDERRDAVIFNGGPGRAYDEFYAAVKTAGRYQIVGNPAEADLLFEIGFTAPMVSGVGAKRDSLAEMPYDPQIHLAIRDPKTNALLWAMTEHVQWAILQGNRDKNFDQSLARIVSDLRELGRSSDKP
jgi:hypothetical protein